MGPQIQQRPFGFSVKEIQSLNHQDICESQKRDVLVLLADSSHHVIIIMEHDRDQCMDFGFSGTHRPPAVFVIVVFL